MPIDSQKSLQQWVRYQYCRDNGHNDFVDKAELCEKYFRGLQWQQTDLAKLQSQRRPALTINKILSTMSNVMGEQIYNRTDTTFQPSAGAPPATAEALTKVFRQISDSNQLDWKRSDMFCDGVITSRGFLECRLDFSDHMQGEVRVEGINPKNVIIDPDAEDYDPDTWNDVMVTKWMTWQDIGILYNMEDAKQLKDRSGSWFQYGFDSIERVRDRFGPDTQQGYFQESKEQSNVLRNIRVIERQHRVIDKQPHFVDPMTGDMRAVPAGWGPRKVAEVAQQAGLTVIPKLVKRIRWTVTADNYVLHDDWSPYEHFTVVPYFPYFRRGKTIGLVENLLGPQELLNKVSSQELHVINTTANSGWKIRTGALKNMTMEELEQRGAETGLVLLLDDIATGADKIQPNQIPSGLDRISFKAEEHIKTISGVSDYQQGTAREDVSAKAVQENLKRGSLNQAKPLDSLSRTDWLLARHVLSMVQQFYTEPRLINITHNKITGEQAQVEINQPTPEGTIVNDLTVGEYDIVVTSTPHKATLEQSQFEQAQALRELGIQIPDEVLIEHSSLYRKDEILKKMAEAANSEEAQHAMEVKKLGAELELANLKAEAAKTDADAVLKQAKARKESTASAIALREAQGGGEEAKLQMEMQLKQQESGIKMEQMQQENQLSREEMEMELQFKREELELKREELELKRQEAAMKMRMDAQAGAMKLRATAQESDMRVQTAAQESEMKLQNARQEGSLRLGVAKETGKVKVSHAQQMSKLKQSKEKSNGAGKRS
jgi:hypothetical protein